MESMLTQDDLRTFLGTVNRFALGSIAPLVERHEVAMSPSQVDQLTSEAQTIGLLNLTTQAGLGLWENLEEAAGGQLSVAALARLAEENAGIAWHFHQLAFGRWLALCLGFEEAVRQGPVLATIQGFYGLGRTALPRFLRGADLTAEDHAMLADSFMPRAGAQAILHAVGGWRWLVAPFFAEGRIDWSLLPRDQIGCEAHPYSHGLDELACLGWHPGSDPGTRTHLDAESSRQMYSQALQINALALMAIALGAVRHAYQIARGYAAIRWQGGTTIDRLPAVQHLLTGICSAIQISASLIEGQAAHPPAFARTAEVLAVRYRVQPMLSLAASQAMQVMGGIGYMRDTGIEKTLRDTNQLRLMGGTPTELSLFAAEWERLS